MAPTNNPKTNLIRGAAWTIGTRWLIKGLGFINTVIMARLLMPEDYGIVAMGMLVVGLIQTFLDFGPGTALLRKAEVSRDEIDSAWTLGILQGLGAGLVLLWLNPKAWAMALGAASAFAGLASDWLQLAGLLGAIFGLAVAASLSLWCLGGLVLGRRLRTERQWRSVNAALGLLQASSVATLWL